MASVTLDRVVKHYDTAESVTLTGGFKRRPALDNVSIEIADGETVSVVGASGCGKSTLLKVVAGLEIPDRGRILFNGVDVTATQPRDRGVGMVFQDYALYPTMKGKGNLAYYFQVHERSEEEAEQRTREVAAMMGVGFDLLMGRVPTTLSGGEQQRVAIGRCIVRDPTLFLMDEPICNLDAKLRESTRIELKKLLRKFAVTALYVTHDQQEAVFMGDRIAVMRDGRIEQMGSFDDLYSSPANLFVAQFIGSPPIAIISAAIADRGVVVDGHRWPLPAAVADELAPGPVRLGVRPENWQLDAAGGATIPLRHVERIPTERSSFLFGTLAGANVAIAAPLDFPETSRVLASPDWDRAYFFAAGSEETLRAPGVEDLF
ncbi:MAG TPA: ABC transporter ATP-binding protein [Thermomicrobiales bacterium]|nr:ABC transporter ATP-binding protein [Thermomicrobiales bacterium]